MYEIVTVVGLIQAVFGVLIFLTKRPKHISFSFLAGWFAVIAVFLGSFLLPFQVVDYFKPGIFPILFLLGPCLYFYVCSLTVEDFTLHYRDLTHLLPFLMVSIHRSTIPVLPILERAEDPAYFYNKLYYFLFILSLLIYWLYSVFLIVRYRTRIPLHFSNYTRNNSLTWIVFVLLFFLFFFMADFVSQFVRIAWDIEIKRFSLLPLNLTVFVFIMILFGINQTVVYQPKKKIGYPSAEVRQPDDSLLGSQREKDLDEELARLNNVIVDYLVIKKPYLNPEFNLDQMASDLDVSRHRLSQVINTGQNKNFHRLINDYRIKEVKERLIDPAYSHFSVLGIAFECGFNSKSAFNRIFKEETGLTPSEFKRVT
ncbi:Transcriptional Regulator, AraC family protein [Lunatimonas lonarensis]|uniref:Transcriptional Regulator, AraC family protein n=1 Tax=Lunatimonas lonarensis TaxID=1232681 RepID=R7ZLU5_9BACT|nr:helix-turn-helix domain-containing protein [Lunatimonas lonarensis]EON75066.1 Transcriptional Regulator, AraC family protein [Lunatimonas lonarensis]